MLYILFENSVAFHPGYFIRELQTTGMFNPNSLNIPKEEYDRLINGDSDLTDDLILRLSEVSGTTPNHWHHLQDQWNTKLHRFLSKRLETQPKEPAEYLLDLAGSKTLKLVLMPEKEFSDKLKEIEQSAQEAFRKSIQDQIKAWLEVL